MAIGRMPIVPDYTFDGVNKNIPIIFAGKTLEKLYAATFVSEVANIDYVGEVRNQGDKVIIRTIPTIIIRDYKKGTQLNLEHPESPSIEFTVDFAKYFNFALDDIDIKQFDISMLDKWADDAAMQMKLTIESHVLSVIYSYADTYNAGTTAGKISGSVNLGGSGNPLAVTKTNILDILIDAGQVLDEQNIPETERWMPLPAWMVAMLKKSDLKDASLTGDSESPLRNGRIGRIDRWTLYNSNLIYSTTDGADTVWRIPFGHKMGFAFVTQLTKVETYRPQDTFAEAMKGLNVYGFGKLQGIAMGELYVKKG